MQLNQLKSDNKKNKKRIVCQICTTSLRLETRGEKMIA